ncbi:hypothetical protein WSK_0157 [Novosphingobium sp. Rr 2-17]|uniref:hypothetical protein n=1 Tax=Novosphingobium sp. Rr 2-17 TaxID=555793 RepID=UPI0002697E36|nr:hypothetical protein [Novosphingobium sp. Rr 2-17]EIZ81212.1 hypothetical protein WSK_0157 [Novosphingobium sp. Rr 2-17]
MSEPQISTPVAAPSRQRLIRGTAAALAGAAIILVGFVLPAEYGIDPTGVGRLLGLTELGKMKEAQAGNGAPEAAAAGDIVEQTADGGTHVRIVIRPYGGREVKGWIKAGGQMTYQWSSDGAPVEYDFHGEPKDGGAQKAVSFETGKKAKAQGVFKAPFEGLHGWFWKNLSAQPVVIDVVVGGPVERFAPLTKQGAVAMGNKAGSAETGVPYYTGMPLNKLMSEVMSPAAHAIWGRMGYISDEKGTRSMFPQNAEGWQAMERSSLTLAELSNDLLIPGRRVPEPEWDKAAVALRVAALKTAEAVKRKNEDELMELSVQITEACESCHQRYDPTPGNDL